MMNKISCLLIFFMLGVSLTGIAQKNSPGEKDRIPDSLYNSFGLFENEELLEITLRFDLTTYFRTKPKNDFLKANITFHLGDSDSISRDIRLKTRGEYRNHNCTFAPIELNFKKVDFGYSDLNKISKLKLVNECHSGGGSDDQILKEYLVYKLFNVLTDTSFRVRLLKINYIDTERKRKPIRHYGFFIEPLEMLTARSNTVSIKSTGLTQKDIIPFIIDRVAIFNYMIGNYDWAVPGQHNVKVIKPLVVNAAALGIAVPYDFDWTGFVNPTYGVPAEVVGIKSIRDRLFVGICRSREVYQKDLELFADKKDEFYRVINEFQYLDERNKKDLINYLEGFYKEMTGKSRLIDIFLNSCKNL